MTCRQPRKDCGTISRRQEDLSRMYGCVSETPPGRQGAEPARYETKRRDGTRVLARMEPYRKLGPQATPGRLEIEFRRGIFPEFRPDVAVERLAAAVRSLGHDRPVARFIDRRLGAESAAQRVRSVGGIIDACDAQNLLEDVTHRGGVHRPAAEPPALGNRGEQRPFSASQSSLVNASGVRRGPGRFRRWNRGESRPCAQRPLGRFWTGPHEG